MIFWIEQNKVYLYEELIKDLNSSELIDKPEGYSYFVTLIKKILPNKISNFKELKELILNEAVNLNFSINTSGSTSKPKKINVSMTNCIRHVKMSNIEEDVIWGLGYPAGSFASTQVFFQALLNKQRILYLFNDKFQKIPDLLVKHKVSNLCCTPTFMTMILFHSTSNNFILKKITTGGEKPTPNVYNSIKKFYPNAEYSNIYASTETGSLLRSNSDIFEIPVRYKGLIKIKNGTLHVHKKLLNKSELSQSTDPNWYDTKDSVELVNNKQFKFKSRQKGYLNSGGYRINPTEIEQAILEINGVLDANVYGKANSILGTLICADIISKDINSVTSIKRELKNKLDAHKVPQKIKLVERFENIKNGKKSLT